MSHTRQTLHTVDPSQPIWVEQIDGPADIDESDTGTFQMEGTISSSSCVIVLMGPTGSGKSSFIEAIASESDKAPLGISKDQLDSVTQTPHFYLVKNLEFISSPRNGYRGSSVYLMDTPGLADPTISEMQVLNQVVYWRDKCLDVGYVRVLYFHPITDIRVPNSRKRCLDMIKGFWGPKCIPITMLVTSMWDRIPEGSLDVAERRFNQMSEYHWAGWTEGGSRVLKFENTFESSMKILGAVLANTKDTWHPIITRGPGNHDARNNSAYEALFDRIANLEQQRVTLTEDLQTPDARENAELQHLLSNDLEKTELLLKRFKAQMKDYLIRTEGPSDIASVGGSSLSAASVNSQSSQWTFPKQLIKWIMLANLKKS